MQFVWKLRHNVVLAPMCVMTAQQLVLHVYVSRRRSGDNAHALSVEPIHRHSHAGNDTQRDVRACDGNLGRKHGQLLHDRLTVILATSPRPAGRCILHIRSTLRSLYHWLPELYAVTLRIAFDGCPEGHPQFWEAAWCTDYAWQKTAIQELVKTEFANATIVFDMVTPDTNRAGLGGNLRNAFQHVVTPYSYVIQDDFVHCSHFDVGEVLDTLELNLAIAYIRLNVLQNGEHGLWDYMSDEVVIGNGVQCVRQGLTRGCNWGDNNHFVPTTVYRDFLYSMPDPAKAPESMFDHTRAACADQMKWYVYGALRHAPMLCHIDGMYRSWNGGHNNNLKRACPNEREYDTYLAKQCPMSGLTGSEQRAV